MREAVGGAAVTLYGSERDQFGRLPVFLESDGVPIGWLAVRRGRALALTGDPPRLAAYAEAEDDAYIDQLGIWAPDACGTGPGAIIGIDKVQWDPRGPDGDDLNGEFVRLVNEGDAVDLSGWILRDESTRWRYAFPDRFVLVGEVTVFTGCGADTTTELYWCAADPVWSNQGDTVLLLDELGNVVARVPYGAKQDR